VKKSTMPVMFKSLAFWISSVLHAINAPAIPIPQEAAMPT
jgi:hypothetical protein